MKLKTYQAVSMSEALAQVKRELGRDAVIVHTRNFRKGRLLGLFGGRSMWEVTASANVNVPPRPMGRYVPAEDEAIEALEKASMRVETPALPTGLAGAAAMALPTGSVDANLQPVSAQMGEIRRLVEALLSMQAGEHGGEMPVELKSLRQQLIHQEVIEEVADEMVRELCLQLNGRQLADAELVRGKLIDMMASRVRTVDHAAQPVPQGRAKVAAFIGPTGVGKTTTIAKLAANFKIREGKKVGMITIDTYRIAAVDQLKIYAEIIDVPLQVVLTAGELRQAIDSMRDYDILLIDTAGRSQHDRLRLNQLLTFLKAAQPDEVHLVMAATANRSSIVSTLERFMQLGVNRIVMTKLDEATAFGAVLNVAAIGKLPISYVTTGQDVPDDIHPADPGRLARCIMEGSLYVNG